MPCGITRAEGTPGSGVCTISSAPRRARTTRVNSKRLSVGPLPVGARLKNYRILGVLAMGVFWFVYLALD